MAGRRRETHRDPVGHEIALVEEQNNLLVGLLLAHVVEHGVTKGAERVAGVKYVKNDVGGVNDLVKLAVDATRGAFVVNSFNVIGVGIKVCGANDCSSSWVLRGICCLMAEILERAYFEAGALALSFRAKSILEGLGLNYVRAL